MRYPIIRQQDAADCGPAVLAMIAAHHGGRISAGRLRELSGTDRYGATLTGMTAAARHVGFQARVVRASCSRLDEISLPAVAHWSENNRNHFVALYNVSSKRVIIGDPAVGIRKLTLDEFGRKWTGVLLLLTPTPRLCETGKNIILLPNSRLFLDALVAAVLMTILALTSSFFIQALVDSVLILGRKPALSWLGLGMLIVSLARVGFLGLRSYLLAHLSHRIEAETLIRYHRHLLELPLTFFSSRRMGEIVSSLKDAMKEHNVLIDFLTILLMAGVMTWLNWKLAVCCLPLLLPIAVVIWFLDTPIRRRQKTAFEKRADLAVHIAETFSAIHEIKLFRAESRFQGLGETRIRGMLEASCKSQLFAFQSDTIASLMTGISTLSLLWFGADHVMNGSSTVGQLAAFHAMLGIVQGPVERLAIGIGLIQNAMIAANRIEEVLDLDRERDKQRSNAADRPIAGSIEFQNVTFRYGSRQPIFVNLNLQIDAGECIGLIGENSCGKTTLVQLLGRLLEPSAGRVLVDGIDVKDYTLDCLRREVAYVREDVVLLDASIEDNLRFGRPTATPSEIAAAAQATHLDAFIRKLSQGYDTPVGVRGEYVSASERRRIALARAILVNPSILVLDDPTCHLDAESELALQAIIDERRGLRTTIVVSPQRLHVGRIIDLNETRQCAASFMPC
jgi:ATP-binding cassette subfamily B protein